MMRCLTITLSIALLASPGWTQRNPRVDLESRGTVRPSPEGSADYLRRRDGAFAAWGSDRDERMVSQSYRFALKYAECVTRFNEDTAARILQAPIGDRRDGISLRRMAQVNPGCAIEQRLVHPLLLRAAFAETLLKRPNRLSGEARARIGVGVPEDVAGYPLAAVSRCQADSAPALVADLLSTEPGELTEHDAAVVLFERTSVCGAAKLGRLTPTAARLALIDAAYRRSVGAKPGE